MFDLLQLSKPCFEASCFEILPFEFVILVTGALCSCWKHWAALVWIISKLSVNNTNKTKPTLFSRAGLKLCYSLTCAREIVNFLPHSYLLLGSEVNWAVNICLSATLWDFVIFLQLNISYPRTGCQKTMELDEREARFLYEKRIGQEIDLDSNMLGPQFKVRQSLHRYAMGSDRNDCKKVIMLLWMTPKMPLLRPKLKIHS